MKERPILFSGEMVRAILQGRKTQTRRLVKPQPVPYNPDIKVWEMMEHAGKPWIPIGGVFQENWLCPYGQPGDRLWVRETFYEAPEGGVFAYRASDEMPESAKRFGCTWSPSIHMPHRASRITLEITGVRVERLQEISEEDAKSEGAHFFDGRPVNHHGFRHDDGDVYETAKESFKNLWNSIHSQGSWDANPWVWVIEFKRVEKNT